MLTHALGLEPEVCKLCIKFKNEIFISFALDVNK